MPSFEQNTTYGIHITSTQTNRWLPTPGGVADGECFRTIFGVCRGAHEIHLSL
jgi:hypothetical protein